MQAKNKYSNVSNTKARRQWKQSKRDAGYINVNMWLEPELSEPIRKIATDKMLPFSTAVEVVLREALSGEK